MERHLLERDLSTWKRKLNSDNSVRNQTNGVKELYFSYYELRKRSITMAVYVNTNYSALQGQRYLGNVQNSLTTTYQRLSSGLRINSAKDDAAGLQIADRLTSQINGLN